MKEAKEMTILDLINKSVTGEEMPEKVEFKGLVYTYDKDDNDYYYDDYYYTFGDNLFGLTNHYLDIVTIPETETVEERKLKALDELISKLREIE